LIQLSGARGEVDENGKLVCDATRQLWYEAIVRRVSSNEAWQQIKADYAAGIGLREIARKMNVPEGTVLARAKREGWTQQIAAAKIASQPELAKEIIKADAINAITPLQSSAATMQARGERYRERVAGVSERVVDHLESMEADEILSRSSQVEKIDTVARRTFGLDIPAAGSGAVNLHVLSGGRAVVQIATKAQS
jgi:hypothetical protein